MTRIPGETARAKTAAEGLPPHSTHVQNSPLTPRIGRIGSVETRLDHFDRQFAGDLTRRKPAHTVADDKQCACYGMFGAYIDRKRIFVVVACATVIGIRRMAKLHVLPSARTP